MTPFCAAVDWGTSSFRMWILSADGSVLGERRSDEGMIAASAVGFETVLEKHLAQLGADDTLPVIICGMAGARQGWREAGYLDTPAELSDVISDALTIENYRRDVRILPGIAQREPEAPDVMRGEETQLLGLAAEGVRSGLICMPGTHSKWVELRGGRVETFSTWLTGELFGALVEHSILRMAVDTSDDFRPDTPAFLAAVKTARAKPQALSNQLFSIRSSQLLGLAQSTDGCATLSGLLIGLELAGALSRHGAHDEVVLVGSGHLGALYRSALAAEGVAIRDCDSETAVRRGLWDAARVFWGGCEDQIADRGP